MQNERRHQAHYDYEELLASLNESQRFALKQIEQFGWELYFVRKPLFQETIAVIVNDNGSKIGVLEEDGRINMDTELRFRNTN